jgi:hypothetical protein
LFSSFALVEKEIKPGLEAGFARLEFLDALEALPEVRLQTTGEFFPKRSSLRSLK